MHAREVAREGARRHGVLADAPLEEVPGERGLVEVEKIHRLRFPPDGGEQLAEALEVAEVVALSRLELRDGDLQGTRHAGKVGRRGDSGNGLAPHGVMPSTVRIARRHADPGGRYLSGGLRVYERTPYSRQSHRTPCALHHPRSSPPYSPRHRLPPSSSPPPPANRGASSSRRSRRSSTPVTAP